MSAIDSFLSQRIAEQLGWTLVNFVWQGAVVAMALMVILWCMRRRSPQARYTVACAALMLMAIAPVVTAGIVVRHMHGPGHGDLATPLEAEEGHGSVIFGASPTPWPAAASDLPTTGAEAAIQRARRGARSAPSYLGRAKAWLAPKVPWMALAWCVGVWVLSVRNLAAWLMVQRLKRRRVRPVVVESLNTARAQSANEPPGERRRIGEPKCYAPSGARFPGCLGLVRCFSRSLPPEATRPLSIPLRKVPGFARPPWRVTSCPPQASRRK